jgi:hypothetical protein
MAASVGRGCQRHADGSRVLRLDGATELTARSRVNARCLAHQKVLQNETVFAARERCATGPASYLPVNGLRSGFDFDDVIKCLAVRAREGNE